jgi:hypothetical protein
MSVNNMAIEDVYQLLNSLHTQSTGRTSLAPTNVSEFISMANTTLAAGVDIVYNNLMNVIGKTIFSSRPYQGKFKGLDADTVRWGGIIRKISVADNDIAADQVYHNLTDGTSADMYERKKQNVLETRFYGSDVYQDFYTVYKVQLLNAMRSPEELGSFVSMLAQEMSNKWNQYNEELRRTALCNMIAAKKDLNEDQIHLLTEYNQASGQSLTAQDVMKPANIKPFFEWAKARINTLSRQMTARSVKFQHQITGKPITRHTPYRDQRHYFTADYLDIIQTTVLPEAFHNEDLKYVDVEAVDFWQSINSPASISMTPVEIDSDGIVQTANANVTVNNIFGVMFDRDAVMVTNIDKEITNTPYNARGRYYNTFLSANSKYCNDLTEKFIVLLLD